jgi:hypothetical protein
LLSFIFFTRISLYYSTQEFGFDSQQGQHFFAWRIQTDTGLPSASYIKDNRGPFPGRKADHSFCAKNTWRCTSTLLCNLMAVWLIKRDTFTFTFLFLLYFYYFIVLLFSYFYPFIFLFAFLLSFAFPHTSSPLSPSTNSRLKA